MSKSIFRYLILLCLVLVSTGQDDCPVKCSCKRSAQRDSSDWVKVRCGEDEKVEDLEELDLTNIANEIVQLNLSNNYMTEFSLKVQLKALQKLDLSRNHLTALQNNQFIHTPNLKKLDLSKNNIRHIEESAFANLQQLEKLKLNQNQITSVAKPTFDPLISIKQLDISSNPLSCDCNILWLFEWSINNSVKLISNPKCNSPEVFKGLSLKKIKSDDIHCKPLNTHSVHLHPFKNQVVFEGDSLRLSCQVPGLEGTSEPKLEWSWLDSNPKHHFSDIVIEEKFMPQLGLIDSSLVISRLERNHTGIWNCSLISNRGSQSRGIAIIVISEDTRYCPIEVTVDNKGTYTWPRTVVNFTVTMTCEHIKLNVNAAEQKASYFCSSNGQWQNLNTSACTYTSETTRIFEQYSKANLSVTKANILESARHFRNHTTNLEVFKDTMDFIFVVRTIQNYILYLELENDLGAILMDVINNIMDLPAAYVNEANLRDETSKKLIAAIETISEHSSSFALHKTSVATERLPVQEDLFGGTICTWFGSSKNTSDKLFSCVTKNQVTMLGNMMECSVQIPASIFHALQDIKGYDSRSVQHIIVTMYKNNKFFPVDEETEGFADVTSPVVGVKFVNYTLKDLIEPIYVMMKNPPFSPERTSRPIPVWWDSYSGKWSSDSCELKDLVGDNLVFSCKHLGYYGLLQNISYDTTYETAKFRFSNPAIYVGSFILITSLVVAIMTYLLCYSVIQMPKKMKHSLINTWIAISLLCFMFVFGIYQTENRKICQGVGWMLHYLTLCSLLWMCVGLNYMYKRLVKNDVLDLQDDDLPSEQPIQKPILGLYLVGWGVALIVCGISGAVNMKEYASYSHCFLNSGPSLSAVFIPVVILLLLLIVFFLVIRCAVYSVDTNGHLSEGTQATENVDLDLLEPNFPNTDSHSVHTNSTKTASSEVEDPEHAPSAQLKAYIVFLIIYICTWCCCALATVQPFNMKFEEDTFSISFAICATVLGAFTLFFYCVARNDVRTQWTILARSFTHSKSCFRSRNISDASSPNVTQMQIHQPINNPIQELQMTSRSSSRSSSHTKSHSSNTKAAADLNGSLYSDTHGAKINNVNLIVLHRQQYRAPHIVPNLIENPTSTAEMFYNPHQSTVARKFFKKQKRNLMKRNNLAAAAPRDINSDTASVVSCRKRSNVDRSIFGNNSKVNNTNIHVELVRKNKHKNPNILSDSCDECDELNMEKLVMDAERLRKRNLTRDKVKKKQNTPAKEPEPNMRSVSQQCTLDYSSETISDSILDKMSPEKCLPFPEQVEAKIQQSERQIVYPRIITNPSHDKMFARPEHSITSSVSASEIDELYQQIRRGPQAKGVQKRRAKQNKGLYRSDSEVNICIKGRDRRAAAFSDASVSDKVETTV